MSDKSERLLECMNDIRDETLDEAAQSMTGKKSTRWKRWGALAAALALAVGVGSQLLPRMGGSAGSTGSNEGGAGTDGATTFMSYAGPVFPMTLKEENDSVTAARDITLDFQPWVKVWWSNEEEAASRTDLTAEERQEVLADYNEWYPEGGRYRSSDNIQVTDSYLLANSSDADQTVELLYPFVSSLRYLGSREPTLSVDGQTVETVLYAGGYSGGFQGAWGDIYEETGENPGSLNLDQLNSWEEYKALLSDGTYLETALAGYPDLTDVPVVVYELTDPWGPEEDADKGIPNPSIRVTFQLDYEKTTVLTYGFHSASRDPENGFMGQGFSIREEWERDYGEPYYLIVVGDDIENLAWQGYVTGGWDTEKTVEAGVTVRRYETDLDTILRDVSGRMYKTFQENSQEYPERGRVDYEMYHGLLCENLCAYGVLSDSPIERYDVGWLEDTDFDGVDRVFYLEVEVVIPAGRSIAVTVQMTKPSSYDYYCAHTENQGISGYDLVTRLGSNLSCAVQTATLEDRGQIEIIRQNFGFDLETGIRTVTLDTGMEHYYLEVKRISVDE